MSERAHNPHAIAIANRKTWQATQAAERERLTKELAEAEAIYKAWVEPKARFDRARSALQTFEIADSQRSAEAEARIVNSADPLIAKMIRECERLGRENGNLMSEWAELTDKRAVRKSNYAAIETRRLAIKKAAEDLRALQHVECDDVPARVREIMSTIPSLGELEFARA
jgi:hypothetical protein